nr:MULTISPECIES: DUF885 family protein [unclassified Sphingomonas]
MPAEAAGAADAAGAPADARGLLDAAAAAATPVAGLQMLEQLDPARLPPGLRLDVASARAGLAIDAALARTPDDYSLRLQRSLGTGVDPDWAEQRLARELDRLSAKATGLFAQLGLPSGGIGSRFSELWQNERWLYPDDDAGRRAALADMTATLVRARTASLRAFPKAPAFCFDVAVRSLSAAEIAAGKGGYREVPARDRPGAYIVDLKQIRRRPQWTLDSVVTHELLPGHMIQLGIEALEPPHPLRLTYAAAFVEGWSIYAEQLAASWGLFASPETMLGHCHWLLFRVGRALVDLRIHRRGWSIDQAHAALVDWQGEPAYFAPFDTELARIAREPGSRAAEALAWLGIADRAPAAPHARGAYHRAVLAHGRKRLEALPHG